MSVLYKRIYELLTQGTPGLDFEIAVDKNGESKATKILLSVLSGLIDADIRGDIIDDAVDEAVPEAHKPSVIVVTDDDLVDNDTNNYTEIRFNPSDADHDYTPPTTALTNGYKRIRIVNAGDGSHKITVNRYGASNLIVYSGNDAWNLTAIELIQAGDYIEIERDGTNWIKCNEPYWHTVDNPSGVNKVSAAQASVANSFTSGISTTFTAQPLGTLAVRVNNLIYDPSNVNNYSYWRKNGDTNISAPNTSHIFNFTSASLKYIEAVNSEVWLDSAKIAQFACTHTTTQVWISYANAYLQ